MKVASLEVEETIQNFKEISYSIEKSNNICIIGGGPVGIELSGEIKYFYPNKEITLIHKHYAIMQQYKLGYKFESKIELKLKKLGINVISNDEAYLEDYKNVSTR